MKSTKELNGNRSNMKPFKNSSSSIKKAVTIVSPKEELVSITPNERNWRGICIALLVIVAVLALILFFIVLLSPPYEGPFNPGIKFTIDHITGSEFKSSSFNGTWISGTYISVFFLIVLIEHTLSTLHETQFMKLRYIKNNRRMFIIMNGKNA
ncbi:hypothetical protein PGB90_000384 [Kerria lacca]